MIPFKEFVLFHPATLEANAAVPPASMGTAADWTTKHYRYCKIGGGRISTDVMSHWRPIFIPKEKDFELVSGLDEAARVQIDIVLGLTKDTCSPAVVDCDLIHCIFNDPTTPKVWNKYKVTGRHYNGQDEWDNYPPNILPNGGYYGDVKKAQLPKLFTLTLKAHAAGVGPYLNEHQEKFFRLGVCFYVGNYNPGAPNAAGEEFSLSCELLSMRVYYFNPIVNSLSIRYAKTTGNKELILTGLGFKNTDAEINLGGDSTGEWNDLVRDIYFIGLQGQGSTKLEKDLGDFTVDSTTQITIPAGKFPTLDKGTYEIRLEKLTHLAGGDIIAYAGDWRTDPNGRIYKGKRFTFLIDDDYVEKGFRSRRSPLVLMDMSFRDRLGNELEKPIAEVDVRTSNKIYEGLLLNFSTINRAVNDKAGNFKGTSMELDLSNHKKDYSKILFSYPILKNREVDIAVAQADEPESWKDPLIKMIVEDYRLKGTSFIVVLKDLAQKIFNKSIPKKICTTVEYPNLSEDYIGAAMPEVLGLNVLGVGQKPGAVEAVHVDTVNHIYLASYRTLFSIDTVYSDYTAVGGWTVFYDHGGRTYINFGATQEDKIITFDCKGYLFNGWNSANGYIENPAYVLLYVIAKIMEIRISDLVCYSFDEIAALFESGAEEESGRLILQNTQRASVSMKQLLFDYGVKAFVATDGRLECGKKDISNFATNIIIFDQADLQEAADRKWNQDQAINYVKVESDYYPSADKFKSGQEDEKADLIEEIDERREDTIEREPEDRKGGRRAIMV